MAEGIRPIRRVVTGNDEQGRSCVLFDSAAPNVNANAFKKGTGMTDVWVFHSCPAVVSGKRDYGKLPFHFEPPQTGGHLRIVQSDPRPKDYDPAQDTVVQRGTNHAWSNRSSKPCVIAFSSHDARY